MNDELNILPLTPIKNVKKESQMSKITQKQQIDLKQMSTTPKIKIKKRQNMTES